MGYLFSEKEYYSDEYGEENNSLRRTGFGLSDGYSTFFDYDKERKMSEYLEEYHEYLRRKHDDYNYEPPKTFIKK